VFIIFSSACIGPLCTVMQAGQFTKLMKAVTENMTPDSPRPELYIQVGVRFCLSIITCLALHLSCPAFAIKHSLFIVSFLT
jgi:hypothetical protein